MQNQNEIAQQLQQKPDQIGMWTLQYNIPYAIHSNTFQYSQKAQRLLAQINGLKSSPKHDANSAL